MNESQTPQSGNFAGKLVRRLDKFSYLIDAATGETIVPSDLGRLISSFGASVLSAGLKPGDPIVIGCVLSPPSSIAYLGAMYAGLVPVPVEESRLASSGDVLLNRIGAKALWTEKPRTLEWICKKEFKFIHGRPSEMRADTIPPTPREENDLAALVATSGSSDIPRFVMVSHGNLCANTEAIIRSQHLENDERAMLILPLSYCFGASVLHTHLYRGGGVVFDRRFMFPDKVLHAVNRYACTTFAGVPTVYNILLRRSNIRSITLPGLRRFLQAGGPLAPQHVQEMRTIVPTAKFYVMYGQTEATAESLALTLRVWIGNWAAWADRWTIWWSASSTQRERMSRSGRVGEIVVRGPSVTLGYLNEPEASRRVFKDGWLRHRRPGPSRRGRISLDRRAQERFSQNARSAGQLCRGRGPGSGGAGRLRMRRRCGGASGSRRGAGFVYRARQDSRQSCRSGAPQLAGSLDL